MHYIQPSDQQTDNFFDPLQEFYENQLKNEKKKGGRLNAIEVPHTTYFSVNQNYFPVKQIKGKRLIHGQVQYLISWENHEGGDTWEKSQNLKYVMQMVNQFEEQLKWSLIRKASNRLTIRRTIEQDFAYMGQYLIDLDKQVQDIPQKQVYEQPYSGSYVSSLAQSPHHPSKASNIQSSISYCSKSNPEIFRSFQTSQSPSNWSLSLSSINQNQNQIAGQVKDLRKNCYSKKINYGERSSTKYAPKTLSMEELIKLANQSWVQFEVIGNPNPQAQVIIKPYDLNEND